MKKALIGVAILAFVCSSAMAQESWQPPRTPDGKPDLQGTWTNASLTTLERSPQFKTQEIPADRARQMEQARARMMLQANAPSNPNEGAPTDGNANAGYNSFWIDPGTQYGVVKGQTRSSWIVEPADGRIPYTAAGKKHLEDRLNKVRGTWDGPEIRPQGERCIVGFGSTAGPPMVNVLYNNHYQIVQSEDSVMILVEMVHDARVVRLGGTHVASNVRKWMGDSIGRWEGETLVVETTNFTDHESFRGATRDARVIERFTRVAPDKIHYRFTVEDPNAFTRSFTGELPFYRTDDPIYEYACHEGNYALRGILAGAREQEKATAGR
jgi:hypothetical protein